MILDTSTASLAQLVSFKKSLLSHQFSIVIDSGASQGLFPLRDDFITFKLINQNITDIGSQSDIEGIEVFRWKISDQNGLPLPSILSITMYHLLL